MSFLGDPVQHHRVENELDFATAPMDSLVVMQKNSREMHSQNEL